jgi:hypothetical protein
MAIRDAANTPADITEFVNSFFNFDKVNELVEGYKAVTGRAIPIPAEYEQDPGLRAAGLVGGKGIKSGVKEAVKKAPKAKSLLNIFK